MVISDFSQQDLPRLEDIQPAGWNPIRAAYELYLSGGFSHPLKAERDGRLAGVASINRFGTSAWLSHVIVHPDFRGQGIGGELVDRQLAWADRLGLTTLSLIATDLGRPLYLKKGFADEIEYLFFAGPPEALPADPPGGVRLAEPGDHEAILALDRRTSGEDRRALLSPRLTTARVAGTTESIAGFWLPDLGEGLVMAETAEAGIALLGARLGQGGKIVVPAENQAARQFLTAQGWHEERRAWRMRRGPALGWEPRQLWARIGGNFG